MKRIVTSTYRYKRPSRKKKPVLIEVPTIVRKGAAKPKTTPAPANDDRKPAIVTATGKTRVAQADRPLTVRVGSDVAPPPVDPAADRKPVIVTVKKRRRSRFGDVPDLAPEEHRRRGEAATELWREMMRRMLST